MTTMTIADSIAHNAAQAGSKCTSGCPTQDHTSYAQCLKSKGVAFGYDPAKGFDATRNRKFDAETQRARRAMEGGIMPDNCTTKAVDEAYKMSEKTGMDYRSDTRPDLKAASEHLGLTPMSSKKILENA